MTNVILVLILLLIAGGAGIYLYKAKKNGAHCVGCPYANKCASKSCDCGIAEEDSSYKIKKTSE